MCISIVVNNQNPPAIISIPVIICGFTPTFNTSCPPIILITIIVIIIGVMIVPDSAALTPTIPCMKNGTNIIAPNIPILIKNPIAFSNVNVRFLKKCIGKIGSSAFVSTITKLTIPIRANANNPIICQESHA